MINVSEEKGSFTVEATYICVFIMVVTLYIVSSVIRIHDVMKENGEVEKERFKIEDTRRMVDISKIICYNGKL